jgi:hypothetical protein
MAMPAPTKSTARSFAFQLAWTFFNGMRNMTFRIAMMVSAMLIRKIHRLQLSALLAKATNLKSYQELLDPKASVPPIIGPTAYARPIKKPWNNALELSEPDPRNTAYPNGIILAPFFQSRNITNNDV